MDLEAIVSVVSMSLDIVVDLCALFKRDSPRPSWSDCDTSPAPLLRFRRRTTIPFPRLYVRRENAGYPRAYR